MAPYQLPDDKRAILVNAVTKGRAVLYLGAGASATSTNQSGRTVLQGKALANLLADEAGLPYKGEPLRDVLNAVLGSKISHQRLDQIIYDNYTRTKPSDELVDLLKFSWFRIYTFNLDDCIENISNSIQTRRYFNGLSDKVKQHEGISFLQVIHLHGEAWKPEHRFVLTEQQYNEQIAKGADWYREAANDYANNVPIFIGSRLQEPILSFELDRARPKSDSGLGQAYLITPDALTDIEIASLNARNIEVIPGTLKEFVEILRETTKKNTFSPKDILNEQGLFGKSIVEKTNISATDIQTANHIRLLWKGNGESLIVPPSQKDRKALARSFLEGSPPSWELVATDIPVNLTKTTELAAKLHQSYLSDDRFFSVFGQSGSGKTTALMQSCLKIARESKNVFLYEFSRETPSLLAALKLLTRAHPDEKAIVFLGDAFIYGDSLAEDLLSIPSGRILVVMSARTNEWKSHIRRRMADVRGSWYEFQRFVEGDYKPLSERIIEFVPSPIFMKMSPDKRNEAFRQSRSQLLIALKEVTHSSNFSKVITDEYQGIVSDATKRLLDIIGVATIARTGISAGMAQEAHQKFSDLAGFQNALGELEGIVSTDTSGRLWARHEVYARHILDNVAPLHDVLKVMRSVLGTFTKFKVPVVKNVSRQDATLFKFLLNHSFIYELCRRHEKPSDGISLYSDFEIDFQLDGHYWLQYGEYLTTLNMMEEAIPILERSIQAYPENPFAVHALADTKLRVSARRPRFDAYTAELMRDAVESLLQLHRSGDVASDHYPIVTLSNHHVGALISHGMMKEASEAARSYFTILESMSKSSSIESVNKAKIQLLTFLTSKEWNRANDNEKIDRSDQSPRKHRRRKRSFRSSPK